MSRYAQNVIPLIFSGSITGSDFSLNEGVLPFNTALELCGVSVSFPLDQLQILVWCLLLHFITTTAATVYSPVSCVATVPFPGKAASLLPLF